MFSNFIETSEAQYGVDLVDVIPTKDNVDYYRLYRYTKPADFGRFKEERRINKSHVSQLKNKLLSGEIPEAFINVDINSLCITKGNHTDEAWELALLEGYTKPLVVRYVDTPRDSNSIIAYLTAEEKARKWQLFDYVKANRKEGNSYDLLSKACSTDSILMGKTVPKYSYTIAAALGPSKKYTDAIRAGKFKVRNDCWDKVPVVISEVKKLLEAVGLKDCKTGTWLECCIASWHNIRESEQSFLNVVGIDEVCKYARKYVRDNGSVRPLQQYAYWDSVFTEIFASMKSKNTNNKYRYK